jgi:GTP-binding protein EngB required for normal cell division
MSCHSIPNLKGKASNENGKHLIFALAGNANVGKSVIFNQLTGSNQINWQLAGEDCGPCGGYA